MHQILVQAIDVKRDKFFAIPRQAVRMLKVRSNTVGSVKFRTSLVSPYLWKVEATGEGCAGSGN